MTAVVGGLQLFIADIAALRARPMLDRDALARIVADECDLPIEPYGWETADAILAALGQGAPEPQRATWKPEDGDTRCQQCAQPNPVWATAHDLWNSLVGNEGGVLCPRCFMMLSPETLWTVTAREQHADPTTRTDLGYAAWKDDRKAVAQARVQARGRIAARTIKSLLVDRWTTQVIGWLDSRITR